MFNCSLCRDQCDEFVVFQSHCTICEQIRRIISLYDKEQILETLRCVYLRDETPIANRTKKIVDNRQAKSDLNKEIKEVRKSPRLKTGLKMLITDESKEIEV